MAKVEYKKSVVKPTFGAKPPEGEGEWGDGQRGKSQVFEQL
jgi:hypothetical protein